MVNTEPNSKLITASSEGHPQAIPPSLLEGSSRLLMSPIVIQADFCATSNETTPTFYLFP